MTSDKITMALPSKGAIAQPTLDFFKDCGLHVRKPNSRQYSGNIPVLPAINVLFQRVKDVAYKVADGTAQLGVTGYDVIRENPHEDLIVIHDSLGYGHCELVVAVPEAWIDVENMFDLADVAIDFREKYQRNLRIATTYSHLTREFLHQSGIHHFTLVQAEGAIEAAPTTGYADVIVDLTQTGTTLRENHLRPLPDGVIVRSQACLIGNRLAIQENVQLRHTLQEMLEYIDAAMIGSRYVQITANIQGETAENVGERICQNTVTRGLQGPTIAPVYTLDNHEKWFTVMIIVEHDDLRDATAYLRNIGASHVITTPVKYIFSDQSMTFNNLILRLSS